LAGNFNHILIVLGRSPDINSYSSLTVAQYINRKLLASALP